MPRRVPPWEGLGRKTSIHPFRFLWGEPVSNELVKLFASKLISRPDVKAVQHADGSYMPTRTRKGDEVVNVGFKAADIAAHIAGEATYGHYLLNTDDTTKLFCFDLDLRGTRMEGGVEVPDGMLPTLGLQPGEVVGGFQPANPRQVWANRKDPRRNYLKYCMRVCGHMLAERIFSELDIPVAVAYSGSKGIHVYGLTGRIPAEDARDGAQIVLDTMSMFELERGDSMYKLKGEEVDNPFTNFSIEVYPKQGSLKDKDLGNLLRLPLGKNTKSKDPTFFVDMTAPLSEMTPVDPEWALTTANPWKRAGE